MCSRKTIEKLEASLAVALEAIPAPAVIVDGRGRVRFANRSAAIAAGLLPSGESAGDGRREEAVTKIDVPGDPKHWFLRVRAQDPTLAAVDRAIARWKLSKRQAEVLACLLRGDANKTIAQRLGCAVATVEVHVTALLRKAKAESRLDVIARAWES